MRRRLGKVANADEQTCFGVGVAGLPSHADGGMNFFDSWINKMVVRVGS